MHQQICAKCGKNFVDKNEEHKKWHDLCKKTYCWDCLVTGINKMLKELRNKKP